jgi:hypothetical protein
VNTVYMSYPCDQCGIYCVSRQSLDHSGGSDADKTEPEPLPCPCVFP